MDYLALLLGFVLGALLIGIILKTKISSLKTQIDYMKEQEIKNESVREKQFEIQMDLKLNLQQMD